MDVPRCRTVVHMLPLETANSVNFIASASQLKSKGVCKHFCRDKYLLRNIIWASYSYNDLPEYNCLNSQNMILNENNTYKKY